MNRCFIKIINLLLVLGIIFGYNMTLESRAKENEIAKLQAELESSNNQLEKYDEVLKASDNTEGVDGNVESEYKDGVYEGTAKGYGGDITVEITIKGGVMKDLKILSASNEDGAYLAMASAIVKDILKNQSAEVDTVSGATYSSTGIKNAAGKALEKARDN